MTTTVPTLADRIADAQLAMHRLQIGQAFVRVRMSDGSETEFRPAQINELRAYLDDLYREQAGVDCPRRGAINFVF